ncbi:MAG: carbohydrate-binding domain-containing protein [Oscillospiraceae bacterium]|nr:carbohydrate-binding domain-containing protein [Oscillospiraceae bacterium]
MRQLITKIMERLEDLCMECFDELKDIYGKVEPKYLKAAAVAGGSVVVFAIGTIVYIASGAGNVEPYVDAMYNDPTIKETFASEDLIEVPDGWVDPNGEFIPKEETTVAEEEADTEDDRETIPLQTVAQVVDSSPQDENPATEPEDESTQPPAVTTEAATEQQPTEDFVRITLNNTSATSTKSTKGAEALIEEQRVTIEHSGDYLITGTLDNGIIIVAAVGDVTLTLENVSITNSIGPAIRTSREMEPFTLTIKSVGNNTLKDGRPFIDNGIDPEELEDFDDETALNRNGAIFSRASNLILTGDGSLTVYGGLRHAIHSRNTLTLESANVTAYSPVHGLRSRILTYINNSNVTLNTKSKGIRAAGNNNGNVTISNSTITVNSIRDAIHSERNTNLTNVTFNAVINGGWRAGRQEETMKGIRSDGSLKIEGGTFNIDSAEDCMSAAETTEISNATMNLSTSRRAIRGMMGVTLTNVRLNVEICNIGLRGLNVNVYGANPGNFHIHRRDTFIQTGISGDDLAGIQPQEGDTNFKRDYSKEERDLMNSKCEGCH